MDRDTLLNRLSDIEWEDFEVKEASLDLPKTIWETASACANSTGGWIVLVVTMTNHKLLGLTTWTLFFLISIPHFCFSNGPDDIYNFGFEKRSVSKPEWFRTQVNTVTVCDTVDFIQGKGSFCMIQEFQSKPFHSAFFRTIYLPQKAQTIDVSLYAKSITIEKAWLKIICLDDTDVVLNRDSVSLISEEKWDKFQIKVPSVDVRKIYIEIYASNTQTKPIDLESLTTRRKNKLSVDNMTVELDGKPLYSYPKENIQAPSLKESTRNFYTGDSLNEIGSLRRDLRRASIIGFGETIHGGRQVQETVLGTIIELIEHNECRLVLLELPFSIGLSLNGYVSGMLSIDIEELLIFNNIDIPSFKYFFDWIKDYNSTSKSKVIISGLEPEDRWSPQDHFAEYLKQMYKSDQVINQLIGLLNKNQHDKALDIVQEQSFKNKYSQTGDCIEQAVKLMKINKASGQFLTVDERERIFFQNARFAIETFIKRNEKTAIFSHLGHLDKRGSIVLRFDTRNFGSYMREQYADDYSVIAVTPGYGSITSFGTNGYIFNCNLLMPPPGSIENLCLQSGKNFCYTTNFKMGISSGRFTGASHYQTEFYPYAPNGRYDGLIFIRYSEGNRLPQNWPRTKEEILNYIKNRRSAISNR